ncbi:unnamed protein product [Adineta steineri]|uniref:Cytochrome b561 domain-containing protein n=1 Tax=Adineta steineri TaxID=433720 RepID=A0A814HIK7_9BILA|nr:unnamed protein product [Adineta steineri]
MTELTLFLHLFFLSFVLINCQQLQWTLLSEVPSGDGPTPRRNAAMGFDSSFLILYGGRDQSGMPTQDTFAFNILQGYWERLNFPNPPSSRYGMGFASSPGSGLYVFGGFGMQQGSSQYYNPYTAYGQSGLPSYKQNPAAKTKRSAAVQSKQNFNQMNPTGYNNYNNNDDRADENYYPLQDAWFLSYMTKSWQQTQTSQYGRGLGAAAASPYSSAVPRVIYSMGKSRDWIYSTVESSGQVTSGYNQFSSGQSAIIMYDLSSYSPAYPHARYGHSTTLLTDNHLLLYGGCLSGYGKGGPCPSSDTWLLHLDRGHWERLWGCPTTKYGAAMVTLPSFSTCASMGRQGGIYGGAAGVNMGAEQPVAVLWGGREFTASSIRSYLSPREEVAVFSLSQKEWTLRRAAPSSDGGYPIQREGAAYVAGCFQNAPGMFVFGGRSVSDGRLLSDLWFLQASPQDALNAPRSRSCIYPFSYYHLHGIFQFFTYGIIFPVGYLVGRHATSLSIRRPLHMILQLLGVACAICGFAFGVHSVRAPARGHFKSAHSIIGIITFILTIIQFLVGIIGAFFLGKRAAVKTERISESGQKIHFEQTNSDTWGGEGTWRIGHRILGLLILALGVVNISLGVFLAVLPLPVWIVWFIWMGFLVLILGGMEIVALLRQRGTHKGGSLRLKGVKREDPKGTSRTSLPYTDEPNQTQITPKPRQKPGHGSRPDPSIRDNSLPRQGGRIMGDDMAPLIDRRQPRSGDVNASANLPDYNRPNERRYPSTSRTRNDPADSEGFDYYVGYAPEHEQPLPRAAIQQQNEHNLTRVRLQ